MSQLTKDVVQRFCQHADWSNRCWLLRSHLFDKNQDGAYLKLPHYAHLFLTLSVILQEYWLSEVVKLNDPAVQQGKKNLTVDYVYRNGNWSPATEVKLAAVRDKLKLFSDKLRTARNKLLSHKDMDAIMSDNNFGEFEEGEDERYFESLQDFVNIVHLEYFGQNFPFDDLVENDVEIFMSAFVKGAV